MEPRDYNQAYQSEVISNQFAAEYDLTNFSFSYEDYQPPLYYLLQTPVFWLSGGSLIAMRLMGVLLGAATLFVAHLVWRELFPDRPWLGFTALAFFAFLPQHIAIQASMNNDSLGELLIALALWLTLKQENGRTRPQQIPLIAVLGAALLTKVTAYLVFPAVGLVILWRHRPHWATAIWEGIKLFVPALLIGAIWWVRNLMVYGWPDFLGIQIHDEVVVGQVTTAEWIDQFGLSELLSRFAQTTFRSFWGQFGWMGVVMPSWVYQILAVFTTLVFIGWLVWLCVPAVRNSPRLPPSTQILFTTLFILNLLLYFTYNLTYVQHQGRYLFAALIPISTAVAFGIATYTRWITDRWPPAQHLIPTGFAIALIGLDLLALFRFIVPALS